MKEEQILRGNNASVEDVEKSRVRVREREAGGTMETEGFIHQFVKYTASCGHGRTRTASELSKFVHGIYLLGIAL